MRLLDLESRFWTYVDQGTSSDDCWLWVGSRRAGGYGQLRFGRQTLRAHRLSYEIHVGPISPGFSVLHKCDIPPCVNPGHLMLGTQKDNMQQAAARHRTTRVLTDDEAALIRSLTIDGWTQRPLAARFGVDRRTVGRVQHREAPYA